MISDILWIFLGLGVGYLLGALPFAVWLGKWYGVDVLNEGSKNPGATNVKRLAGPTAGRITFFLDAGKGALAVGWPLLFAQLCGQALDAVQLAGLLGAILGHSFSIFIGFRGGKGVATTIGGLAVFMPIVLAIGLGLWVGVFFVTRYVSLASIVFALSLPISSWLIGLSFLQRFLALFLAIFVVFRHRSNIVRLMQGKENRS